MSLKTNCVTPCLTAISDSFCILNIDSDKKQNWIFDKFLTLLKRIESHNPSIDDYDLRWVENKLEEIDSGKPVHKSDVEKANNIWNKWK